jgi:hypothetical protein
MTAFNKRDPFLLFLGDIISFYISLWLSLLIRFREIPSQETLTTHGIPFTILIIAWFLVLYIGGLYEKRTIVLRSRLPNTLLRAQIANSHLGCAVFLFHSIFWDYTENDSLYLPRGFVCCSLNLADLWLHVCWS